MKWREHGSSVGLDEQSTTRILAQWGILPRQEMSENVEQPVSFWNESAPKRGASTSSDKQHRVIGPKISKPTSRHDEVVLLKKWDGFVSKVSEDGFFAQFEDDGEGSQVLEADFDLEELVESDQEILAEGVPVVWCISREKSNGGQKRCSTIYLRRQTPPGADEVAVAAKTLDEWFSIPTTTAGI